MIVKELQEILSDESPDAEVVVRSYDLDLSEFRFWFVEDIEGSSIELVIDIGGGTTE